MRGFEGEPVDQTWGDAPQGHCSVATEPTLAYLVEAQQGFARHVGHLDVVRELIDGKVGE